MRRTSFRVRTTRSAHRRTAWSTVRASGHVKTDELNDLTGIADCLLTVQRTIVLKRRTFQMAIWIAGRSKLYQPIIGSIRHGTVPYPAKSLECEVPLVLGPRVEYSRIHAKDKFAFGLVTLVITGGAKKSGSGVRRITLIR